MFIFYDFNKTKNVTARSLVLSGRDMVTKQPYCIRINNARRVSWLRLAATSTCVNNQTFRILMQNHGITIHDIYDPEYKTIVFPEQVPDLAETTPCSIMMQEFSFSSGHIAKKDVFASVGSTNLFHSIHGHDLDEIASFEHYFNATCPFVIHFNRNIAPTSRTVSHVMIDWTDIKLVRPAIDCDISKANFSAVFLNTRIVQSSDEKSLIQWAMCPVSFYMGESTIVHREQDISGCNVPSSIAGAASLLASTIANVNPDIIFVCGSTKDNMSLMAQHTMFGRMAQTNSSKSSDETNVSADYLVRKTTLGRLVVDIDSIAKEYLQAPLPSRTVSSSPDENENEVEVEEDGYSLFSRIEPLLRPVNVLLNVARVARISVGSLCLTSRSKICNAIYTRRFLLAATIPPPRKKYDPTSRGFAHPTIPGAVVLEDKKGLYKSTRTALLDFKGQYPSVVVAANLCFTTLSATRYKNEVMRTETAGEYLKKPLDSRVTTAPILPILAYDSGISRTIFSAARGWESLSPAMQLYAKDAHISPSDETTPSLARKAYVNGAKFTINAAIGVLGSQDNEATFSHPYLLTAIYAAARHCLFTARDVAIEQNIPVLAGVTDSIVIDTGLVSMTEALDRCKLLRGSIMDRIGCAIPDTVDLRVVTIYDRLCIMHSNAWAWTCKNVIQPDTNSLTDSIEFDSKGLENTKRNYCSISQLAVESLLHMYCTADPSDFDVKYEELITTNISRMKTCNSDHDYRAHASWSPEKSGKTYLEFHSAVFGTVPLELAIQESHTPDENVYVGTQLANPFARIRKVVSGAAAIPPAPKPRPVAATTAVTKLTQKRRHDSIDAPPPPSPVPDANIDGYRWMYRNIPPSDEYSSDNGLDFLPESSYTLPLMYQDEMMI